MKHDEMARTVGRHLLAMVSELPRDGQARYEAIGFAALMAVEIVGKVNGPHAALELVEAIRAQIARGMN